MAVVVAGFSRPARAEETAAADLASVALAERRAAEAFEAYTKKEYSTAVALYLQAYEAAPSGAILYNIARIYDTKLADRPLAINFYRRYTADPDARAELVEVANRRLRELHEVEIVASKRTEDAPREGAAIKHEGGSPPPARDSVQKRQGGWSPMRWVGVALSAAGLVGVGVGGGFGLAAMSKAGTAHDLCDGNACTSQQGVDASNAGRRAATISNIGFGAGGALLLTGAVLYFWGGDRTPEQSTTAALRVEAQATVSALSLQLTGRW